MKMRNGSKLTVVEIFAEFCRSVSIRRKLFSFNVDLQSTAIFDCAFAQKKSTGWIINFDIEILFG